MSLLWIDKAKRSFSENPKKAQLITLIILLLAIPITVFAALTIQNLLQQAGGGDKVAQIVDANGSVIAQTSDPQVYLKITLPSDWIASAPVEDKIGLVGNAYAQASCPTITCGTNSGAGGICSYGDPVQGKNSNVSGCTATCPNGKRVPGFSVSVCQTNNCYFNDCTCYPNAGACDSAPTPTPLSTPSPLCPGSGMPSSGWGGACSPGTPEKAISTLGSTDTCTIAGCQLYTGNTYCWYNSGAQYKDPTGCAQKGATFPSTTPTPSATPSAVHTLKNLYIANGDTDGSTGGSNQIKIDAYFGEFLNKPIPWRLNSLIDGQSQASRVVQVTLFDGNNFVPYIATVLLTRSTQATGTLSNVEVSFQCNIQQIVRGKDCPASALAYDSANFPIFDGITYEWGISSTNSIGSLNSPNRNITNFYTQNIGTGSIWVIARQGNLQARKAVGVTVVQSARLPSTSTSTSSAAKIGDINKDGVVNAADVNILISQYGQKDPNLSADLDRNGTVDGVDYNILLRDL